MNRIARTALALAACTLIGTSLAHAQTRTWVSGVGDDFNPCSRTAPCKTYAGAISKTAAGGEISTLDPGGFGAVTITKSITINGDGTLASILGAGSNGVIVNAPAGSAVVLRNLSIHGVGTGLTGVRVLSAGSVTIDKCDIAGFTQAAIDVEPATVSQVVVKDSFLRNGGTGIQVSQPGGRVDVSLTRVTIKGSVNGVEGLGGFITVSDSTITENPGVGVLANGGTLTVEGSMLTSNGVAVDSNAGAIRLSNNGIYDNLTGLGCGGGILASAGDNRLAGNPGAGCAPTLAITVQ